jgi:hypothetical protein
VTCQPYAQVSDAGTPAVADPGADLAAACALEGIPVVPVPGPCAPAAALVAAGLPTVREGIGFFVTTRQNSTYGSPCLSASPNKKKKKKKKNLHAHDELYCYPCQNLLWPAILC